MSSIENCENKINKLKKDNRILKAKILDLCNDIKECKDNIQELKILIKKKLNKRD